MNDVLIVLLFIAVGFGIFFALRAIERSIGDKVELSPSLFDDFAIVFIRSLRPWVYGALLLLLATYFFTLPEYLNVYRNGAVLILATFQAIVTLSRLGRFLIKHSTIETKEEQKIYNVFSHILSLVLWVIGILFILSNLGVNITALLAGFGIGGLAVAFALQNILKDLFSYMTILLDEPIKEGDNIQVAGMSGKVKHIGIKTTKLVTPGGEGVVVSNNTLTTQEVLNYGVARKRRVKEIICLDTHTSDKKVTALVTSIYKMLEELENIEPQSVYVHGIGSEGIKVKILYFVKNRKMELYRETKTSVFTGVLALAKKNKIDLYQSTHLLNK